MAFGVHEAHSCSFQRHHRSVTQNFEVLFLVQLVHTPQDKQACELYPPYIFFLKNIEERFHKTLLWLLAWCRSL